jgi:hypothetical protein
MKIFNYFILFTIFFVTSTIEVSAKACKDNKLGKITICHAGNDNNNPGRVNFVNICVDFAAVHGHLKNHDHDSVGPCGTTELKDGVALACNAGIKHEEPTSQVCYRRSNPVETCQPTSCVIGETCDCVCSGISGGANNVDFMTLNGRSFEDIEQLEDIDSDLFWTDSKISRTSNPSLNNGHVDINNFVVATNSEENFVLRDDSLSFHLGSELFGAEYFVDLCWKNINEDFAGEFDIKPKYGYKNKSGFGSSYVSEADITTRTEVYCLDKDTNSEFLLFDENYLSFPGQSQDLEPYVGSVEDVSFCRVRHYFKENSNFFRSWNSNAIEVATTLEVTLTDSDQNISDKGLTLCHPIEYYDHRGKLKERVCQLRFDKTTDYEKFVLHYEDEGRGNGNSMYSVTHNHDFRALEGNSCRGRHADAQTCYDVINAKTNNTHLDTIEKDILFRKALSL